MTRAALLLFAILTLASTAGAGALPDTVRIAASGHGARYHLAACTALAGGSTLVWRVSADSLGYSACKRCWPAKPAKVKRVPRGVAL